MIRNLNQLNFKGFGNILPERTAEEHRQTAGPRMVLSLNWGEQTVYLAKADTWVRGGNGLTVLSVSLDGMGYQSFYLDKPVCVKQGVYFYIAPFRQEQAGAELAAQTLPEEVGKYSQQRDFSVGHRLHVTQLYTFFYQEKERGFFFSGESHPMLELTYVDQGTMHSVADGQDLLLEQGDMVIYGADQWHMQYADIDVAPRYVTISFELEGSDLAPLLNRKLHPPQVAVSLLQQMLREQERMDEYATDMIICQLTQLLLAMLRQQEKPSHKLKTSNSMNSENEIIRRAQQYISENIREKLTVPHVARMVDVSPSYMTALFHKNLQISPGEYIRRIKIQESKQMIREGNMNFTEIAAALHYSTVHHFSRQFKDKFGITPTEYAKSVR